MFPPHLGASSGCKTTRLNTSSALASKESFDHEQRHWSLIIITFLYKAHSDWLKQRALSENICRVSWISNFCFGILTNLTQIKHPCDSDKCNGNELNLSAINVAAWRLLQFLKCTKRASFARFRQTNSWPSECLVFRHNICYEGRN